MANHCRSIIDGLPDDDREWTSDVPESPIDLCDARHAAEPDNACDIRAAEWRAKFAALQTTTRSAATQ